MRSRENRFSLAFMMLQGAILLLGGSSHAATLTLDSLSFVSFEDEVTMPIVPGGSIQFDFGAPNADGSIPFTIQPAGVNLPLVTSYQLNASLQYSLASPATGLFTPSATGRRITFTGTFTAQDVTRPAAGTRSYVMSFTTENASARSLDGTAEVNREGFIAPTGANYVQIVGATVAKSENEHGSAVYLVLSGSFDQLP